MDILVTYDIATAEPAGARRLGRVASICERYGVRVQYSVFECRVSDLALERFVGEIEDAIDHTEDSVHLYRISGTIAQVRTVIGRPRDRQLGQPWIL